MYCSLQNPPTCTSLPLPQTHNQSATADPASNVGVEKSQVLLVVIFFPAACYYTLKFVYVLLSSESTYVYPTPTNTQPVSNC